MKCYTVFQPLRIRGVYTTWQLCKDKIYGCTGAVYASFNTIEDAIDALRVGSLAAWRHFRINEVLHKQLKHLPCLVVDAACSGTTKMEYRGLILYPSGASTVAFKAGPYDVGTNNIGEYLAIVNGLRWLREQSMLFPLYSDSAVAISWVQKKHGCHTGMSVEELPIDLQTDITTCERWIQQEVSDEEISRVYKWNTSRWGEIPADYGRK